MKKIIFALTLTLITAPAFAQKALTGPDSPAYNDGYISCTGLFKQKTTKLQKRTQTPPLPDYVSIEPIIQAHRLRQQNATQNKTLPAKDQSSKKSYFLQNQTEAEFVSIRPLIEAVQKRKEAKLSRNTPRLNTQEQHQRDSLTRAIEKAYLRAIKTKKQ